MGSDSVPRSNRKASAAVSKGENSEKSDLKYEGCSPQESNRDKPARMFILFHSCAPLPLIHYEYDFLSIYVLSCS